MRPFTDEERARLTETLRKPLGPEYISSRTGPSGRQSYLNGGLAIQLANDIFGFDGWSSEIKNTTVDYVDIDENKRAHVGVSVTMRITLKDGTYREDIGYATSQNSPHKGLAIDKARKAATTDAMKRTLKNFGNALGNCLYDKSYLQGINLMSSPQIKFSPADLYRHEQFQTKNEAPQLTLQQAPQQRVPAPTINPSNLQQARSLPPQSKPQPLQVQSKPQAPFHPPRVQSTPTSTSTSQAAATAAAKQQQQQQQQLQLQQQQQANSRKRHQEQIDMQQKRAKPDVHHERPIKQEVMTVIAPKPEPILLPEDSFSYEGDEEFYALFQNEPNDDEFTVKEDEFVKIDDAELARLDRVSQASDATIAAEASVGVQR